MWSQSHSPSSRATARVNTFQISAGCRGAIHCAQWDASTPQVGAMNCAPTPHLSSLRLFEMYCPLRSPMRTNFRVDPRVPRATPELSTGLPSRFVVEYG